MVSDLVLGFYVLSSKPKTKSDATHRTICQCHLTLERNTALFQDIRTRPVAAAVTADPIVEALANPVATALVEQALPVLAVEYASRDANERSD
jgi:hypothetical protein